MIFMISLGSPIAGKRAWIPGTLVYQDNDVLHSDHFEVNAHNVEKKNVAETISVPCTKMLRHVAVASTVDTSVTQQLQRAQRNFAAFETLLHARSAFDAVGVPFWLAGSTQRDWCVEKAAKNRKQKTEIWHVFCVYILLQDSPSFSSLSPRVSFSIRILINYSLLTHRTLQGMEVQPEFG